MCCKLNMQVRYKQKHSRQGVLNWFIRQIMDGEEIKLFGSGSQIRDINFVDDVSEAFLLVGASDNVWGQAYNLGGDAVSLEEFVKKVIEMYGKGKYSTAKFTEDREKIEIGNYIANWEKIKKDIKWQPNTSLEKGIEKTIKYYEKNKKQYWN